MNDVRAELLSALRELCDIVPEMRVGQLLAAVGEVCDDIHGRADRNGNGLWDATDEELLEAVRHFCTAIEESRSRKS
jgi:hypothetical protein